MSDIALCCAPACPIFTACRRHEVHHEQRGWANYAGSLRLSALGTFECDRLVPWSHGGQHVEIDDGDSSDAIR